MVLQLSQYVHLKCQACKSGITGYDVHRHGPLHMEQCLLNFKLNVMRESAASVVECQGRKKTTNAMNIRPREAVLARSASCALSCKCVFESRALLHMLCYSQVLKLVIDGIVDGIVALRK